jgi:DNA invertase Pin-like site-specific DNA recombinase
MAWSFIEAYADSAISGKKESRPALDRLLADAKSGRFDVVMVDDVSRLTRAGSDVMAKLRRELEKSGVTLYDVQTGMRTSQPGAALMFGIKAAVAENYLEQLAYQVRRGQANRARSGFVSTGGPTLGYRNVDEPNPPDPKHVRKLQVIEPESAKLVRRIFEMYADGMGYRQVALSLNEEGIAAPRDGHTTVKSANGWTHSTIRFMLHNPVYRGQLVRTIGDETITVEKPDLRIIDDELWARVSARFSPGTGGRPAGSTEHPTLIGGLLKCGVCGGTISLAHRGKKGNGVYAYYSCTIARTRGAKACTNKPSISARTLTSALVGALQDMFADPTYVAAFIAAFNKRLAKNAAKAPSDAEDVELEISAVEARIANLVNAIAALGLNQDLVGKLKSEQAKRDAWKAQATKTKPAAIKVPSSKEVAALTSDLMKLVTTDVNRGREVLLRCLGPVTLTPAGEGYKLKGAFDLGTFLSRKNSGKGEADNPLKTASASDCSAR